MLYQRVRLLLSVQLLLAFTMGICGRAVAEMPAGQLPFHSLTVIVGTDQREAFYTRLHKFAYDAGFADRIARTNSDDVLITMWREDLKIYATNEFDPTHIQFSFYKNCGYPEIAPRFFDLWIDEFKKAITEVSGIKISGEESRE